MLYGVTSLIVTATVLPFLGSVLVALRFYVRLRLKPTFVGIDDWLILFACVLVWGQGANQIVAAVIGELGRDNQKTVEWRLHNQQQTDYAVLIFEKITYTSIKLSVLFFYRRIFFHMKSFRIANDILIVLVTVWGTVFLFSEAFLCKADSHHGHPCAPQEWASLWFAITDVLTDIAILVLPYPCIRMLQMSRRDKIGLSAIFFLGTLPDLRNHPSGIRREDILQYAHLEHPSLFHPQTPLNMIPVYFHPSESETSPNRTPPNIWTTVEVSVGLVAACLPPLGPLMRRAPSLKFFTSKLHGFSWRTRSSRSREFTKRLSSVDDVSRVKEGEGDGDGYEMGRVRKAEVMDPTARIGQVV
ncbi:MAG: hypothetical protein Q9191_008257 [Dirinaria sp. TL-2023a]